MLNFNKLQGFDWDKGNLDKNRLKHNVTVKECEQIFYNKPLVVLLDEDHSTKEPRYKVYGKTSRGRNLALAVTIRNQKIRVIVARDQSRKERKTVEDNIAGGK